MKKYMVIAAWMSNENNNLELIDFDLTEEQAKKIVKEYQNNYTDDELESICICEHGEFIYN